jgi:hypothetical protein
MPVSSNLATSKLGGSGSIPASNTVRPDPETNATVKSPLEFPSKVTFNSHGPDSHPLLEIYATSWDKELKEEDEKMIFAGSNTDIIDAPSLLEFTRNNAFRDTLRN